MTPRAPSPTPRTLAIIAAWGAATTVVAYTLSRGAIAWFIVWMLILGVGQRVIAYWIVRLRGEHPRPGWWH
jgi:hypothetical protein